jgi:nicotinamidase-related amidase
MTAGGPLSREKGNGTAGPTGTLSTPGGGRMRRTGPVRAASALAVALLAGVLSCGTAGTLGQGPGRASPAPTPSTGLPGGVPSTEAGRAISVRTSSRSYFARDEEGNLIPEKRGGKVFYRVGEEIYTYNRVLHTGRTALIVMDPWEDNGATPLDAHFTPVVRNAVLPLVRRAIRLGIPVLVLTNDPGRTAEGYGSEVVRELRDLRGGGSLEVLYHQDFDSGSFAAYLRTRSIDTLVYCGFASNMCVIGRGLGMIPMHLQGFRLFFVPEASAAVEFQDTWADGRVHEYSTLVISQWIAELIRLSDFLAVPETAPH